MTDDYRQAIEAALAAHREERHFPRDRLEQLLREHEELWTTVRPQAAETADRTRSIEKDVQLIIAEMHGAEVETAAGTKRKGGFVEQIDAIYETIGNGGVRFELTRAQWTFLGTIMAAVIAASASIIIAMITG